MLVVGTEAAEKRQSVVIVPAAVSVTEPDTGTVRIGAVEEST